MIRSRLKYELSRLETGTFYFWAYSNGSTHFFSLLYKTYGEIVVLLQAILRVKHEETSLSTAEYSHTHPEDLDHIESKDKKYSTQNY